jgi:hypothetical protein
MYQLEEAICKTGHSQEKCCNLEHITSIRSKAKLIDTAAVSGEDSVYLSDTVVKLLMNPRLQGVTAMLRERYLEVYRRSETRSKLNTLLEEEGLIWNFIAHRHGLHDECTCTQ